MQKVLIIDDETAIQMLLENYLGSQGFDVVTVSSSKEGVEQFQSEKDGIECAIVDHALPDEGGIQTVAKLREINPDLPVLLVSGAEDSRILDFVDENPKTEYLNKPFDMGDLLNTLKSLLNSDG